jgi:hypothetical protein
MKRYIAMLGCFVLFAPCLFGQAENSPEAATRLFTALAGSWSCSGAFADGRPLAADVTFTPQAEGRSLLYRHRDRAPNSFVQDALWGPDEKNHAILSLAFAGDAKHLVPELFVANSWTATSIVFEAKPLTSPPFAPNRFTYKVEGETFRMVWEVQRQSGWAVGDEIQCVRPH